MSRSGKKRLLSAVEDRILEGFTPERAARSLKVSLEEFYKLAHEAGWREREDGRWQKGDLVNTCPVGAKLGVDLLMRIQELFEQGIQPPLIAKQLGVPYEVVYRAAEKLHWCYDSKTRTWHQRTVAPKFRGRQVGYPSVHERVYRLLKAYRYAGIAELAATMHTNNHSMRQMMHIFTKHGYIVRYSVKGVPVKGIYTVSDDKDPYADGFFDIEDHPIYQEDVSHFQEFRRRNYENNT